MIESVVTVEEQVQLDRKKAFELLLSWLEEIHGCMLIWKDANPKCAHRSALYFLMKTISDSCKGSCILTDQELYDQAGALLRVALENLWLLDLFGSEHPEAEKTLTNWINGEKLKPSKVRKMLAEEFDEIDLKKTEHQKFMDNVYSELCNYIHPQPISMSAAAFELNLLVVLTSILGVLPNFLYKFEIEVPDKFFQHGDVLAATIPLLLTNHLPQELREKIEQFSSFIVTQSFEGTLECGDD